MKKIIIALFAVLLTTSIALAAWQDTFSSDIAEKGLAATVAADLALGASPGEMIDIATAAGVEAETLVTAMCDAGLTPQDLQEFLTTLNMNHNTFMTACVGQENISYENKFPGATKDSTSVSKVIHYSSIKSYDSAPAGTVGGAGTPTQPASGNNFDQ